MTAACTEHFAPLLPAERVSALVSVVFPEWSAFVTDHACEHALRLRRLK